MFPIQDQISVATRSNLESQLAMFASLSNKTFEGVERLFSLNLNVVKASLEESSATARQLLAAKDPQEFFSLSAAQTQPNMEKALAYGRHLAGIASSTQAEFTKAAEVQFAEANRKISKLVDDAAKNAPAGSENIVAIVKSSIENANASYQQLTRTTKQAMEALEANMNTAVSQLVPVVEKAVGAKK